MYNSEYLEAVETANGTCNFGDDPVWNLIVEFLGAAIIESGDIVGEFQILASNESIAVGYINGQKAVCLCNGQYIVAKS